MTPFEKSLESRLQDLDQQFQLRRLPFHTDARYDLDFSSNDYLNLSTHPDLIKASCDAAQLGVGSTGSRLISGDSALFHELEKEVASFKKMPAALVFNSGFQANIGVIPTLLGPKDVIFFDRLCHASLIDGIIHSKAKFYRFKHNDSTHLRTLCQLHRKQYRHACIITESIFSMDGDQAPLRELIEIKKEFDCMIMLDEAHATGVFGPTGAGLAEAMGICDQIDISMGTFSKALGSAGAFIACSEVIKDFLITSCRSFIFSTSLPLPVIGANLAAIKLVSQLTELRENLLKNATLFREALIKKNYTVYGCSQIIPVILKETQKTLAYADLFRLNGITVPAIRYPTVPNKEARLRFSVNSKHSSKDLALVLQLLN